MQGDKSVAEQSASLRMELLTLPPLPQEAVIILTLVQDFFARTHSGPLLWCLMGFHSWITGTLREGAHIAKTQRNDSEFRLAI